MQRSRDNRRSRAHGRYCIPIGTAFRNVGPARLNGQESLITLVLHLERLETRVALECLLDRLTDIELVTDDDPHIDGQPFRFPTALPVTFDSM
ncbi:hypothetical protein BST16_18280 [Mycobacterium asiaticum DSM 44297]|nr:hypothetical protein BST16_18280 [Mycobacterium asiaticum DSM 44297]